MKRKPTGKAQRKHHKLCRSTAAEKRRAKGGDLLTFEVWRRLARK